MTVPPDFLEAGWADDANGLAELDRTRALCAAYASPECLPPDIEAEACEAFRKLAAHLECGARTGWIGRKPAFAREMALQYQRELRSAARRRAA